MVEVAMMTANMVEVTMMTANMVGVLVKLLRRVRLRQPKTGMSARRWQRKRLRVRLRSSKAEGAAKRIRSGED